MKLDVKELIAKLTVAETEPPIKVVRFGWQVSGTYSARAKIADGFTFSNALYGTVPDGYTFVTWMEFVSIGWVGHVYAGVPTNETVTLYTSTGKGNTTSGASMEGTALFVRNA